MIYEKKEKKNAQYTIVSGKYPINFIIKPQVTIYTKVM